MNEYDVHMFHTKKILNLNLVWYKNRGKNNHVILNACLCSEYVFMFLLYIYIKYVSFDFGFDQLYNR